MFLHALNALRDENKKSKRLKPETPQIWCVCVLMSLNEEEK